MPKRANQAYLDALTIIIDTMLSIHLVFEAQMSPGSLPLLAGNSGCGCNGRRSIDRVASLEAYESRNQVGKAPKKSQIPGILRDLSTIQPFCQNGCNQRLG